MWFQNMPEIYGVISGDRYAHGSSVGHVHFVDVVGIHGGVEQEQAASVGLAIARLVAHAFRINTGTLAAL